MSSWFDDMMKVSCDPHIDEESTQLHATAFRTKRVKSKQDVLQELNSHLHIHKLGTQTGTVGYPDSAQLEESKPALKSSDNNNTISQERQSNHGNTSSTRQVYMYLYTIASLTNSTKDFFLQDVRISCGLIYSLSAETCP